MAIDKIYLKIVNNMILQQYSTCYKQPNRLKLLDPQKGFILKFYTATSLFFFLTSLKQYKTYTCKKNDTALGTCYLKEN